MAVYTLYGTSNSVFESYAGLPFSQTRLYSTATECGVANADGSTTYFFGTGLVWSAVLGRFTAGAIERIAHYANGGFVDQISGLDLTAQSVQGAFENAGLSRDAFRAFFFAGDDVFDLRHRAGNAAPPVSLIAYGGNDKIYGGRGNDSFWGYSGADTIDGGDGHDFINGGLDNDILTGGSGNDRFMGDGGSDTIIAGAGDDAIFAGAGNDGQNGGDGLDTAVYYRSFFDLAITRTGTGYTVIEPNGQDTLTGIERFAADDGVFIWNPLALAFDKVSTVPGMLLIEPANKLMGTTGNDTIPMSGTGKTNCFAYAGDDSVTGSGGWDVVLGGSGNDTLRGEASGQAAAYGTDRLYGEAGDDVLCGMRGNDMLYGGDGMDRLSGGDGGDQYTGGAGADVFVLRFATAPGHAESWGSDWILDFSVGSDRVALEFGPWGAGGVPANLTPQLALGAQGWVLSLGGAGSLLLKGLTTPGLVVGDILA